MLKLHTLFNSLCADFIEPIANLLARIYLGWFVFLKSGLLKLDDFIKYDFEETIESFNPEEDGEFVVSFLQPGILSPEMAAYLATAGEVVLPVLLILGLFTRFSAAGLFVIAAVIQYGVFQEPVHLMWMVACALLVGSGGSKISLDYLLLKIKK